MGATFSRVKTWINGEILTHTDLNAEFNQIYNNLTPAGVDDMSANAAAMQANTDPFPASSESLPTSAAGEIERIRYQLKTQFGLTQWYHDTTTPYETFLATISGYRRPNLIYVSATTVDVENNTGTSNQTKIVFPDGTTRSVTEDTSSVNKYRRFIITAAAEFTSGTEDSGLRSGLSEATDTWYAIYAVKSVINTANFVLSGDTTLPLQANFSTLNSRYGTNGWVYLGLIRNGDGASATGDILKFKQEGNWTGLDNSGGGVHFGLRLAVTAGAATLTYTYAAGTGTAEIPGNVGTVLWNAFCAATGGTTTHSYMDATGTYLRGRFTSANLETVYEFRGLATAGIQLQNGSSTSIAYRINLGGWADTVLGVGSNPVL